MTKTSIKQRASAIVSAIIMGAFGMTSFASADSITNTGPNSVNTITTTQVDVCKVINNNNVDVTEVNTQTATTGDAVVTNNTSAGSATTGAAINENISEFIVNISNDSAFIGPVAGSNPAPAPVLPVQPLVDECGNPILPVGGSGGGVNTTGPGSVNTINRGSSFFKSRLNNNRVHFGFSNGQFARSGRAFVSSNTSGGGAGSGPAHNANAPAASVAIANAPAAGSGSGSPAPATAPSSNISNTGPGSNNSISSSTSSTTNVVNNNNVSYAGSSSQAADSGSATVTSNTSAGGGGTGMAANSNDTYGSVNIVN